MERIVKKHLFLKEDKLNLNPIREQLKFWNSVFKDSTENEVSRWS